MKQLIILATLSSLIACTKGTTVTSKTNTTGTTANTSSTTTTSTTTTTTTSGSGSSVDTSTNSGSYSAAIEFHGGDVRVGQLSANGTVVYNSNDDVANIDATYTDAKFIIGAKLIPFDNNRNGNSYASIDSSVVDYKSKRCAFSWGITRASIQVQPWDPSSSRIGATKTISLALTNSTYSTAEYYNLGILKPHFKVTNLKSNYQCVYDYCRNHISNNSCDLTAADSSCSSATYLKDHSKNAGALGDVNCMELSFRVQTDSTNSVNSN